MIRAEGHSQHLNPALLPQGGVCQSVCVGENMRMCYERGEVEGGQILEGKMQHFLSNSQLSNNTKVS